MKCTFFRLLIAVVMGFSLISCNKDSDAISPIASPSYLIHYSVDPSNSNNPVDYVGVDHNECMEFMGTYQHYDFTDSASLDSTFKLAFVEYEHSKGRTLSQTELDNFYDNLVPTISFDSICVINNYNNDFKNYVTQAFALVDSTPTNTISLSSLISSFKALEGQILNCTTIPQNDKTLLLAFTSICRHSAAYAYEIYTSNGTSSWHQTFTDMPTILTKQSDIDKADASGFWA